MIDQEDIRVIRQIIQEELSRFILSDRYVFERHLQLFDGKNIQTGKGTGTKFGTETSQKIGFHDATPTIQRASADQAAVATTAVTQTNPYGYSTASQATAIFTLLNEIRAALVEKGLIKGSA